MLPEFRVFGIAVRPYTLFLLAGAAVCLGLFWLRASRRNRELYGENIFALEMLIVSVAAALPAAMVVDSLFKIGERGGFELGGATFYGGALFAATLWSLLLLLKKKRAVPVYERLCELAPAVAAGHALGRVGCFFGGCCFGSPTDGPFGVVFPEGSAPYDFYGGEVAIHPTQLYEAFALLLLFFLLFFACKRAEFPCYLIFYGIARFVIEFYRADDRGSLFGLPLSPAQCISVVLVLAGEILLIVRLVRALRRIERKTGFEFPKFEKKT